MALTPEDIERRQFTVVDRGYLVGEVDRFLAEVAASYRYAMHHLLPGVAPLTGDRSPEEPVRSVAPGTDESLARLGEQVTEVLRAAEELANSLRTEAEADASAIRARASLEVAESQRAAELERDEAERLLVRAQQQADTTIEDAQRQVEAQLREAESAAQARGEEMIDRARKRADEILRAEKAAIERLRTARAELDITLERLATDRTRPILDLTDDQVVLKVSSHPAARDTNVPAGQGVNGSATPADPLSSTAPATETGGTADLDPVARMVRAAVGRAVQHSAESERSRDDVTRDTGNESDKRRF